MSDAPNPREDAYGQDDSAAYAPPPPAFDTPPVARMPRFCGTCGAPWEPQWVHCEACAWHQQRRAALFPSAGETAGGVEPDGVIRIRSAILLYFSLLAVSVVAIVASVAEAPEVTVDLAATIGFAVIVTIWCGVSGPRAMLQLFKPARLRWFALAVLAGIVTVTLAFAVVETMHRALGVEKLKYADPYLNAGFGLWIVVLTVCVEPAVFEELAFRGVMLTSLRPTLSNVEAVLVSAMLFMSLHISPTAFPHTLAMGVAAGFMRLASGSILPCMLMHFVHNGICIMAEVYWGI